MPLQGANKDLKYYEAALIMIYGCTNMYRECECRCSCRLYEQSSRQIHERMSG